MFKLSQQGAFCQGEGYFTIHFSLPTSNFPARVPDNRLFLNPVCSSACRICPVSRTHGTRSRSGLRTGRINCQHTGGESSSKERKMHVKAVWLQQWGSCFITFTARLVSNMRRSIKMHFAGQEAGCIPPYICHLPPIKARSGLKRAACSNAAHGQRLSLITSLWFVVMSRGLNL